MTIIDRPPGINVGVYNPGDAVYIKGNETTDGSLRLIPDTEHAGTGVQFELRADGVWNVTTIDLIGEDAVALGHSLEFGAIGDHIRLFEADGDESVVPTRHYSDALGSSDADESVKLGPIINESVLQPDDSGALTGVDTPISWAYQMGLEKMIRSVWIKPVIDFDADTQITLRRDNASGGIIHRRNYPASAFIAGGSVEFIIPAMFEVEHFDVIWFQIESLTGLGTLSLEADLTDLFPWLAVTYYDFERVPLMNYESGVDDIIYAFAEVGQGNNTVYIATATLTNEGNQTTVVPSTVV